MTGFYALSDLVYSPKLVYSADFPLILLFPCAGSYMLGHVSFMGSLFIIVITKWSPNCRYFRNSFRGAKVVLTSYITKIDARQMA